MHSPLIYGMIPSQYYFTVRPFLASCEQTVRGAIRESLVRFSLGLFTHLVIDLRRPSIIPLLLFAVTPTLVSFMVARLAAWGFGCLLIRGQIILDNTVFYKGFQFSAPILRQFMNSFMQIGYK